jgi:hypothetical protein
VNLTFLAVVIPVLVFCLPIKVDYFSIFLLINSSGTLILGKSC